MHSFKIVILFYITIILSSCTVYKSPDRKDFESATAGFKVQSLKESLCTDKSVKSLAETSRLVSVLEASQQSDSAYDSTYDSVFLWEYQINGQSVFESNNSNGLYCIYENI